MTDGNEKTERSPKTVWATTGAPKELQGRDNPSGTGTYEELRSEGVGKTIQGQTEDEWLQHSICLVARASNGNGANQRRVRYFGFETQDDPNTESEH